MSGGCGAFPVVTAYWLTKSGRCPVGAISNRFLDTNEISVGALLTVQIHAVERPMIIRGVNFNMEWQQGTSPRETLPRDYGIYCEVLWPVRGIRIGISKNIWGRHGGHASWMRSMKVGTGSRTNRSGPLANHAKDWGDLGLETFTLSTDPRLEDNELRYTCETQLHQWAEEQTEWKNFNGEKWVPKNYGKPVLDEVAAAEAWGVTLNWTLP